MELVDAINTRRTAKVIANPELPLATGRSDASAVDKLLEQAVKAPCHYACDRIHLSEMTSPVPWRVYKYDAENCRQIMQQMIDAGDTTKIPNMLAAADFLLQVTWLPDAGTIVNAAAGKGEIVYAGTLRNMEHIAAASSFVQNVLLCATAEKFQTYWSSGGPLRQQNIPDTEILLGSVFLYPQDVGDADVREGNLAHKRGSVEDWSKWVSIS